MPLGISEEHLALHDAARRWVEAHCPASVPRALLDAPDEELPEFWGDLASLGWLGLHVGEGHGGEGYGLLELAVVLEELGRAVAPGPFLTTVLAAEIVQRLGETEQREALLPGLTDGSTPGALAFGAGELEARVSGGDLTVSGSLRPVLGAGLARVVVAPTRSDDGSIEWVALLRDELKVTPLDSLDATRRMGEVHADGVTVPRERRLGPDEGPVSVADVAALLVAAECVGGADWCVDTAASYAKVREQFGRPIGQFQAVKHRCADMLMALEQSRAAVWDAARGGDAHEVALASAVAGALAPEVFFTNAKDCIQILGGIGFTWEHDAHLYLKRATALRQLLGGPGPWQARTTQLARGGVRRTLTVDLPAEADEFRAEVRAFLDGLKEHDKGEWRRIMADNGYLVAHYPRPWGLDADAVQQLVIDEEFAAARVRRNHLQVGAWVLPTLVAHGTPEQQERWIPPTLRGELNWCQLFSEPGAGSDLAGLSTKAIRTEGGFVLSGQKVWTSMAREADWGICLARTDASAPKHDGITCFLVDMRSDGIEIRPLRELTGADMFNEVFLEDVFVPDDCVVGAVDDGWRVGRTTLQNERVSMGSGSSFGFGVEGVLKVAPDDDPVADRVVGELLAEAQSLAVMAFRMTVRSVSGAEPGPESSLRKLLGVEHDQRVQEVGLEFFGPEGAVRDGDAFLWIAGFLGNRCLTIAGGTSEVQRNVIAERLLGLPKDP